MKVYLVLQWRQEYIDAGDVRPEFQGVFSTLELATAACKNHLYGIEPFELDEALPDERQEDSPLTMFPLAEQVRL